MSETYLNGKLKVSSLAAPSVGDIAALEALSPDERQAVLSEALDRARSQPAGSQTPDQIREAAAARAAPTPGAADYAL